MTTPTVSIIVRVFNCQKYVGQAIESLLAQTWSDFEIVAVDDCSTDNTMAILQAYAQQDTRLKIYKNETNQGPVRTMNIGLRHARGEFVAIQDADDISLPHRLETQINFLRSNPHIALIGGGEYKIDEDGEEIMNPTGERRKRKNPDEVRQYLQNLDLERGFSFSHSSVMFRREAIEAIGLYDEFFANSHDYDMLIRMADRFDIIYYEEPLVKWRWRREGITSKQKQTQIIRAELARMRSKAQKEGITIDLQQEYERLKAARTVKDGKNQQSINDAVYNYEVGILLFEKGQTRLSRQKFTLALKENDNIKIFVKALAWYTLSFFPGMVNSRLMQRLRKIV